VSGSARMNGFAASGNLSYERFPDAAKPFIRALPLTALNDALRGVMNDAMTARQLAPQLINLTLWTVVSYVVALKIFRWQ